MSMLDCIHIMAIAYVDILLAIYTLPGGHLEYAETIQQILSPLVYRPASDISRFAFCVS